MRRAEAVAWLVVVIVCAAMVIDLCRMAHRPLIVGVPATHASETDPTAPIESRIRVVGGYGTSSSTALVASDLWRVMPIARGVVVESYWDRERGAYFPITDLLAPIVSRISALEDEVRRGK